MIINGQRYEAEPAVEAYVKNLQAENEEQRREILRLTDELKEMDEANEYLRNQSAKDFENVAKLMDTIGALKKESAQLEEKYQKATGVIAATDCAECKRHYENEIKVRCLENSEKNKLIDELNTELSGYRQIINAEPVKHGHWIGRNDGVIATYQCSNCGDSIPQNIFIIGCDFNYCPYCDAKMDGGEDNAE